MVVRALVRDAAARLARWSQVDMKNVKLAIFASALLVGVPLIVNAIHELLSGRRDEHLGRQRLSDPAAAGDAAPSLRNRPVEQLVADLRRLRVAVATDSGARRLINWRIGSHTTSCWGKPVRCWTSHTAWKEHGRAGARHRTNTG